MEPEGSVELGAESQVRTDVSGMYPRRSLTLDDPRRTKKNAPVRK
jgi:hypothetical protein